MSVFQKKNFYSRCRRNLSEQRVAEKCCRHRHERRFLLSLIENLRVSKDYFFIIKKMKRPLIFFFAVDTGESEIIISIEVRCGGVDTFCEWMKEVKNVKLLTMMSELNPSLKSIDDAMIKHKKGRWFIIGSSWAQKGRQLRWCEGGHELESIAKRRNFFHLIHSTHNTQIIRT